MHVGDTNMTVQYTEQEVQARTLREQGLSIAKIMVATGLPERKVKAVTKDVVKVVQADTPFHRCLPEVFDLAVRPQGCKDHELKEVMHKFYGTKWNTDKGFYESNFDKDNMNRVRVAVRTLADKQDATALFVPDWVDESAPRASRQMLEQSANALAEKMDELVTEFLCEHMTDREHDGLAMSEAQCKQKYAARRHILKLAFPEYNLNSEPLAALLERSLSITDALEGESDIPMAPVQVSKQEGPFPEPTDDSAFLDYVEQQGWCKQ